MTDSLPKPNNPILNFEGKKYEINSLPDKVKGLIRASRAADNQRRLTEDNLQLIKIAGQTIAAQLKNELASQEPIQ